MQPLFLTMGFGLSQWENMMSLNGTSPVRGYCLSPTALLPQAKSSWVSPRHWPWPQPLLVGLAPHWPCSTAPLCSAGGPLSTPPVPPDLHSKSRALPKLIPWNSERPYPLTHTPSLPPWTADAHTLTHHTHTGTSLNRLCAPQQPKRRM